MPAHLSPAARQKLGRPVDPLDQETMDLVAANGDLSRLSAEQRTRYYNARCSQIGLDPQTLPLRFCVVKESTKDHGQWKEKEKLVLYSPKEATDQLRALHQITIDPTAVSVDDQHDIVKVIVRGYLPNGRQDTEIGAVALVTNEGTALSAYQRANAYMKAFTKAKRRLTLSLVGGGLLDESEMEDLAEAVTVPDYLPTPAGTPAPLSPSRPSVVTPASGSVASRPDSPDPLPVPSAMDAAPDSPTSLAPVSPPAEASNAQPASRLGDAEAAMLWTRAQTHQPPITRPEDLLAYTNVLLNTAYTSLRDLSRDHYSQLLADLDPTNNAPDSPSPAS